MKPLRVKQIAEFLSGEVMGDDSTIVENVAKIEDANEGDITFVSNPKYVKYLSETAASVVIVSEDLDVDWNVLKPSIIKVKDPYFGICMVMDKYFSEDPHYAFISERSNVSGSAFLGEDAGVGAFSFVGKNVSFGKNVTVYPNCYIGDNVRIGDDTVIYPNVTVYKNCVIGKRSIIHGGVVIGSDGFGHAPLPDGSYAKIPQIGNVVVGDDVEIGSNTVIDRATMGSTVIEDGVKLDNLIQVAHNARVGKNTVIAAQTGLSGSTELGERCVIGGQVGFVGHIKVANGTQIGAQSGIMKTIAEENQAFLGSPIKPIKEEIKAQVLIRKLSAMYKDLERVKKELEQINESKTKDA